MIKNNYDYIIENLEYVKDIVNKSQKYFLRESDNYKIYFRGQANAEWPLVSSIARKKAKEPKFNNENELFKYIAERQHNGTETRFLDYTKDPMVALFFACNEKNISIKMVNYFQHIMT